MSDLLSIGSSGVNAYRSALAAIGDNVANAETQGYARRNVILRESATFAPGQSGALNFGGVKAVSVDRAWDHYQAADSRISASLAERAQIREHWLGAVEAALGDPSRDVGTLLGNFFNAGVALAANPADKLSRLTMLSALDEAAGAIRATAAGLAQVSDGIAAAAQLETDALNADLEALTEVNLSLRQAEPGRSSHASLQDERDRLIDSIAGRIDVSVSLDDQGVATLTLARQTGVTLLDPRNRALAVLVPAADGRLALNLRANGTTTPLPLSAGRLAGLLDVAASTADKRATLDTMALDFATAVNDWSAQGFDQNGAPGAPLLAIPAGAASITLLTSDPAAIAAASATSVNGNLLDLNTLRGSNGAESSWATLVAGQAQALSSARSEAAAAASRRDGSFAARDEVSGIDLDREAAELLRFQQAYGASTRIIQVARETLQSILDLF